ncbi:MAG: polyprenyl synthetase family protein [Magnetococcus sp. DMHC-6]
MSQKDSRVLDILKALIGDDLNQANRIILQQLDAKVELIPTLGSHLIESGGKRLRPILTLISARLFGYRGNQHALMAAVVEFIHTATLLHDDVVDKSSTRRGRATANQVWGFKAPVLVGDFLFSRSFQILVDHGDLKILKIIADACAVISEGEVMQLVISNDLNTNEDKYLEVVTYKTSTLFAAAAQVGAVLAQANPEEEYNLYRYGLMLGNAYQVVDDALDYSAQQEILGKSIGDDFQDGKITLPVIHAYRHGNSEERTFWRRCMEERQHPEGALRKAIDLLHQRGSLNYTMEKAQYFVKEAHRCLETLPPSPEKEALSLLADFSVERSY